MNFWQTLPKPITGLAPMDGWTDVAFRYILAVTGKPSVIFTEFVNADGIIKGGDRVMRPLFYHEVERPIVAQLFGLDPEMFKLAAIVLCELGFDGIDINMGCPAKTVSKRGAGAGLINNPELAKEIIFSVKEGVETWVKNGSKDLPDKVKQKITNMLEKFNNLGVILKTERQSKPVSVKTRIGFNENTVDTWLPRLMDAHPANITVHGRTLKQMYTGQADWNAIKQAAEIVKTLSNSTEPTTVLGNGDVSSITQIPDLIEKYKVDGVLIGRATVGNPWFFSGVDSVISKSYDEVKAKIIEHLTIYNKIFGENGFVSQRKHLSSYIKGFPNASELRSKLMIAPSYQEVIKILNEKS